MKKVKIVGEYITLGQLLKLVSAISNGGQAKSFLASNDVLVNGERETRRGRKLRDGDVVSVGGGEFEIQA